MKRFNAGAWRPAQADARLAANDLVARTLGQHGLLPPSGQGGLNGLLAQLGGGAAAPVLPEGAVFASDTFTCDAGSRAYRTYIPAPRSGGVTGVVVMLHGCTQNPEDFAAGTGMNQLADRHGFVLVYPAQSRGGNAQSCWNWFSRGDQKRGRGEPAILAGLTRKICSVHGVGRDATFVAGLSAGAAMAAILGEAYPDVFAAIGAHSGLPVGAAKDVPSAFAAMAGTVTEAAPAGSGSTIRTIVFHGTADATVHPSNGDRIVQRALVGGARQVIEDRQSGQINGRSYSRIIATDPDGRDMLEHWQITGLGHAWSGGQAAGSYTDTTGPDASAEMIRFFFDASGKGQ
ncbi:extracellular catalytic domain type 1 short-chain-length polyhydroxyalkanoate depolymerase [Pseudorhodobacter aquimaris]|uniref:extracellular catalytic domain type 1 short-chain-length polyhydroxyalkanoate depolymerase n=1 Tax=Pseudorhodobacter aquimaris TaxID=687412 RepID=UPI00067C8588|nr:PHB depolymerase family esterase [Pseudorhodobacter aquimaris]